MNSDLRQRLRARLWESSPQKGASERRALYLGRYLFALARDLFDGQLSMRAMSLVYTTLLSIVPLLALAFSVLKALGVHNSLEPVLYEFLRPLGGQARDITDNVIGFVERMQVGVLGSLGVALLFYTAFSLIQKVEASFNYIWRVERTRPFAQRIGEYLGVLMVGPVLVFSALGLTASVLNSKFVARIASVQPFGDLIYLATQLIPYLLIVAFFTFAYSFITNTRVRTLPALVGGLAAGVLWQTGSVLFASFVARATDYNAIYSSFAILIFLLIWLQLGWLILLIGCQLAYYVQNPQQLRPQRLAPSLSGREAEWLALTVLGIAGRRFIAAEPALTQDQFQRRVDAPSEHLSRAIETLIQKGLLIESGPSGQQLSPARDLDGLTLGEAWRRIREAPLSGPAADPVSDEVNRMLDQAEARFLEQEGSTTLRAWLTAESSPRP